MNFEEQTPPKTSLEAAALILSNGETKDPNKAAHIAEGGNPFNLDALQRAHLRRMMGVDFEVSIKGKRMTVFTKSEPYVTASTKFSGIINEKAVDKLVDLCLEVKLSYEKELAEKVGERESTEATSSN